MPPTSSLNIIRAVWSNHF